MGGLLNSHETRGEDMPHTMTMLQSPASSPNMSFRRLDHLVLPSGDLDAQAAFYQRLGFRVGQPNVHPWGTENRIVQFNGSFLELITIADGGRPPGHAPRAFSFGAHVGEWLSAWGEGMSMLVLDAADGRLDAKWFDQAGIGGFEPFHFGRKGKRPDGSEMEVAFTLAFAQASAMPDLGFFSCQQHNPENFWNTAYQVHENTAVGIGRVVIVHDEPINTGGFLKSFAGGMPVFEEGAGLSLKTRDGVMSVWTPDGAKAVLGPTPCCSTVDADALAPSFLMLPASIQRSFACARTMCRIAASVGC
jgi:catechol 2,3-dioxygenase-like lactoylglutathione lyase family enzyme